MTKVQRARESRWLSTKHLQDALDLLLPAEPRATPLVSAAAAPAAAQAPAAKSAAPATVAEVAARARSKAQEQQARAPINGLVVPPPPLQRGLAMLDPSQVQAAMPVIDWNLPPAFPSEAGPAQPIKLPRHSKVMQVRCADSRSARTGGAALRMKGRVNGHGAAVLRLAQCAAYAGCPVLCTAAQAERPTHLSHRTLQQSMYCNTTGGVQRVPCARPRRHLWPRGAEGCGA